MGTCEATLTYRIREFEVTDSKNFLICYSDTAKLLVRISGNSRDQLGFDNVPSFLTRHTENTGRHYCGLANSSLRLPVVQRVSSPFTAEQSR